MWNDETIKRSNKRKRVQMFLSRDIFPTRAHAGFSEARAPPPPRRIPFNELSSDSGGRESFIRQWIINQPANQHRAIKDHIF